MIRFSAALVVAAIGVLIAGVATSSLLLVYVAIGISAAALLVLAVGVVLKRDELFAEQARPAAATGTPAGAASPADEASAAGAGQTRVPAGVGGSAFEGSAFEGSAFEGRAHRDSAAYGDSAYGDGAHGARAFGDWASSRAGHQAPAQQAHDGTPAWPGAWPPPVPGFPAAAADALSAPESSPAAPASFRRPPAPPTRADPVLPWSGSLPTRVDLGGSPLGGGSAPGTPASETIAPGKSVFDKPAFDKPQPREAATEAMPAIPATPATPATSAEPDAPVTPAEPDASQAPPSWLDDVDDDLDSSPARRDWLTGDEDAELAGDAGSALEATPGSTASEAVEDAAADAIADADADTDLEAGTDLDAGLDLDAAPDLAAEDVPESDADLDADLDAAADLDAVMDVEQPGGPDDDASPSDTETPPTAPVTSGTQQVTVVPGVPRYHDEDCILIRFMADGDVQHMTVPEAEKAGCTPCRACQPED